LRRTGARVGDDIWVSGSLGEAALALAHLQDKVQLPASDFVECARTLHQPQPRVALGLALRGVANSAIDISDGLLADLGHILKCSKAGAEIRFDALPISPMLRSLSRSPVTDHGGAPSTDAGMQDNAGAEMSDLALRCALAGGDDYELCFTASVGQRGKIEQLAGELNLLLTCIGIIVTKNGCMVRAMDGSVIQTGKTGYDHFA
jgi:thiamine-monophosphate kinase